MINVAVENFSLKDKFILNLRYGLKCRNGKCTGKIREKKYRALKEYCTHHGLKYYIDTPFGKRSGDYRQRFFSTYPAAFGNCYFCAYCGIPLTKRKITVDHLIPVDKASKDPRLQKKLKKAGYRDINDPRNLAASCLKCNRKKGTKTGLWILRGRVGRINAIWYIRHGIRIIILVMILQKLLPCVVISG